MEGAEQKRMLSNERVTEPAEHYARDLNKHSKISSVAKKRRVSEMTSCSFKRWEAQGLRQAIRLDFPFRLRQ